LSNWEWGYAAIREVVEAVGCKGVRHHVSWGRQLLAQPLALLLLLLLLLLRVMVIDRPCCDYFLPCPAAGHLVGGGVAALHLTCRPTSVAVWLAQRGQGTRWGVDQTVVAGSYHTMSLR
jgi:hypothetical protein